jgi:hypothetical protein
MMAASPEPRERLSHPAQSTIGKCSPIMVAKWWPEMSHAMPRADFGAWRMDISGARWLSISAEIATHGGRSRKRPGDK